MKKIIAVKVLYYLFFTLVIFIAIIIFLEIIDFPAYDRYLGSFFRVLINALDF